MAQAQARIPIHLNVHPRAALRSGLIAGAVFLIFEMALVAVMEGTPWGPPRMMAAIVLGDGVLPPPATFDATIVAVAMVVHFGLSILLAFVFALGAGRLRLWPAVAAGAAFGLAVYAVNFYGFTTLFPWFAMARNAVSVVGHLVFGMALAFSYKRLGP